jgi:hypothetical protein
MSVEPSSPSPQPESRPDVDCKDIPDLRKRKFVIRLPRRGIVTLTLLWVHRWEWPLRPESTAGSAWHVWRLGPFLLAFRIDA